MEVKKRLTTQEEKEEKASSKTEKEVVEQNGQVPPFPPLPSGSILKSSSSSFLACFPQSSFPTFLVFYTVLSVRPSLPPSLPRQVIRFPSLKGDRWVFLAGRMGLSSPPPAPLRLAVQSCTGRRGRRRRRDRGDGIKKGEEEARRKCAMLHYYGMYFDGMYCTYVLCVDVLYSS